MTSNHYDTIIIGAGHFPLTLPSPTGRGGLVAQKQGPVFTGARGRYAGTAMYSAEAVPSGIGSLSSSKP